MNKKILLWCIGAAVLIVLASFSPVVGSNSERIEKKVVSPLFTVRTNRKLNRFFSQDMNTNYVGKGRILNLFPMQKSSLKELVDIFVKLINNRPEVVYKLIDKVYRIPNIAEQLNANGIKINDVKDRIKQIKNNPDLVEQEVDMAVRSLNSPMPMYQYKPQGLSTSNPVGCAVIAIFAFVPLAIVLGLLIGTMTIVTCFIPGCLETIVEQLYTNMIQGLTQPDGDI